MSLVSVAFSKARGPARDVGFETLLESVRELLSLTLGGDQDLILPGVFSAPGRDYLFIVTATDRQGSEMMAQRLNVQLRKMQGLKEAGVLSEVTNHSVRLPPLSDKNISNEFMRQVADQVLTIIESLTNNSSRNVFPSLRKQAAPAAPRLTPQVAPDATEG